MCLITCAACVGLALSIQIIFVIHQMSTALLVV